MWLNFTTGEVFTDFENHSKYSVITIDFEDTVQLRDYNIDFEYEKYFSIQSSPWKILCFVVNFAFGFGNAYLVLKVNR